MVRSLHSRLHLLFAGTLLFSLVTLVGCGGKGGSGNTASVEGKVKVDGVLANSGNVSFKVNETTLQGHISPDGSYRVVGLPVGAAQITVTPATNLPPAPKGKGAAVAPDLKGMPGADTVTADKAIPIPAKYGKVESSGLTFTVASGSNTFDIELTK